jgi:hypothetical protein
MCESDSGERRDPGFQPVHMRKVWVPTYVGMTKIWDIRRDAGVFLDLQRALAGNEAQKDMCIR